MSGRLLPTEVLDPRSNTEFDAEPTHASDNVPLTELRDSIFRLPAKGVKVLVADTGAESSLAVSILTELGRTAELTPATSRSHSTDRYRLWSPPTFLLDHIETFAPGRALCLACGSAREAVALAAAGWHVTALDRLPDALEKGQVLERLYSVPGAAPIEWRLGDLRYKVPDDLSGFDLVTQLRFWHPLTKQHLTYALRPGGYGLLEVFAPEHWLHHKQVGQTWTPEEWIDWGATHTSTRDSIKVVVQAPT